MELNIDIDTLRTINALTTPIALFLSVFLVGYAVKAYRRVKNKDKKVVAISLLGVGIIFFVNALLIASVYFIIFTSDNRDVVNLVSNVRILISNILTITTSMILLGIYSDRI